mgnify:CR=1 FL=1
MEPKPASGTRTGDWIPDDRRLQPHQTIRSQAPGFLVYDIDPSQIPTETITHGGHRILIDSTGSLREIQPEDRSHYEVIGKISEGGMGIVYNVQEKTLKREVALKICRVELQPSAAPTQEAGEFTNEAYMTARLDHPGVVPIYALAKDADGRPFFAMKKVSGTSWKDLLHPEAVQDPARRETVEARARQMGWKDHLEILLKVCDAVAYAHSKAILHRDLKPENVMLGEYGEVYVMDWGLALYFDERNEYKRFPGLKPQLAGTPYYMAPEMVRGEMTALGPATDIYLLGGILYEILTGRPPHDGATVMEMLKKASTGGVPPPEKISRSPHITPALSRIVQKALAPLMADRYPTVAEFQQDLRGILANSESMAVCRRASELLDSLRQELLAGGRASATLKEVDKEAAAIRYGKLSECIGSFRQAIGLWPGNQEARRGLLDAFVLQIKLAIRQDDLMLARAQHRLLAEMKADCADSRLAAQVEAQSQELAAQIGNRQLQLDRAARHARGWKAAAGTLFLLFLAGLAGIVAMSARQRALAVQGEQTMFAASVAGRAQMLEQFLAGIEQIASLYRLSAVELMSAPAERLPFRDPTPAGRDGYYFDEDFYAPETRPAVLEKKPRYNAPLSMDYPTVVRSPWARDEEHRPAVEEAAARLGRLNTLFSYFHRLRDDIQWSIAGSEAGLLVGFPGFGRYREKPDYDATKRTWYLAAIQAGDDRPVWGNPYADATTRLILMSCMCRIHAGGRNVGVVGLEVTLASLQKMLLEFSQSIGGKRRALLIRPFEETDAGTGKARIVHRIVVDTLYRRSAEDWQSRMEMVDVEKAGPEISTFVRRILDGRCRPGRCHVTGPYWMAYAPIRNRDWILIGILDRGGSFGAP